jgi:hypothetical protein
VSETPASAIPHLVKALRDISSHWANQYDHPRMQNPLYAGPYGTGVVDGHRACKRIADEALALIPDQPTTTTATETP